MIGFLNGGSPYEWSPFVAAFRKGLSEAGYVEGRNVAIEFRWTFGDLQQPPALARDLVSRAVDVLVTSGGNPPTLAAIDATADIPIVATFGNDLIRRVRTATFERPSNNVTGVNLYANDLETRKLQIIKEVVPKLTTLAVLVDSAIPATLDAARDLQQAASKVGLALVVADASTEAEIETSFLTIGKQGAQALIVTSTAYLLGRRDRLAALAARHSLPVMYPARAYVEAGGLLSYGVDRLEAYRQLGIYTARILRREAKPSEIPILEPSTFELVINGKTARNLGLSLPASLLARADIIQ